MSKFEFIEYTVRDRVAMITVNRPPVNAIHFALAGEVIDAYKLCREDSDVGAVILTSGLSNVFSAGLDLKMGRTMSPTELHEFIELFYFEMHEAQYRLGKPSIAAVNATAMAAGVTWAVSCDMVIASEDAQFGYPEINVGLMPAMHLVHLPRQIGRHAAFPLLFSGESVSAQEMHRLGVVNEVVPTEQVLEVAWDWAKKFAAKSPVVMKLMRDAWMRANDLDYRRNIENAVESMCLLKGTADSREALDAFIEHRQPRFGHS